MYEVPKHTKGLLRGGAAFLLALLLCAGAPAKAAEVTGVFSDETARMLVPVGHTVGIKLFSRGVVVVPSVRLMVMLYMGPYMEGLLVMAMRLAHSGTVSSLTSLPK